MDIIVDDNIYGDSTILAHGELSFIIRKSALLTLSHMYLISMVDPILYASILTGDVGRMPRKLSE